MTTPPRTREDQRATVAWWDANVQRAGGDRKSKNHSRRSALMIPLADAEALLVVKHQRGAAMRDAAQGRRGRSRATGPSAAQRAPSIAFSLPHQKLFFPV